MRKLNEAELMRNQMYAEVGELGLEGFTPIGNIKEGFLFENEKGDSLVVKIILKKSPVIYTSVKVDRPIEQIVEEEEA